MRKIAFAFAVCVFFFPSYLLSFELKNAPLNISSETLRLDYGNNIATYKNKVHVTQGDFEIKCNIMSVFYNSENSSGRESSLEKIEFFNDVILTKEGKSATSDYAIYDPQKEEITLKGNVVLRDKKSYLKGETLVYDTVSKIFNIDNNLNNEQKRVRILVDDEQVRQAK